MPTRKYPINYTAKIIFGEHFSLFETVAGHIATAFDKLPRCDALFRKRGVGVRGADCGLRGQQKPKKKI